MQGASQAHFNGITEREYGVVVVAVQGILRQSKSCQMPSTNGAVAMVNSGENDPVLHPLPSRGFWAFQLGLPHMLP